MNIRTLWFDRLRNKLHEEAMRGEAGTIPGLLDESLAQTRKILGELDRVEVLVISGDVSKRIAPNGEPSEDLKHRFEMPFERAFIEFDPPVRLPGFRHGALRGLLVSQTVRKGYWCRVWTETHKYTPVLSFNFDPESGRIRGTESLEARQVMNFLIWLSGYITSPNVLAVRHNRRLDIVRSYGQRGMLAPSSYYTFEPERTPKPTVKRFRGQTVPVDVRGHFRRAHWHRLPQGGSAWFGTTWVRPYKRFMPVAAQDELEKVA